MKSQNDYPNLLVVIGASAGGLSEITTIIEHLPKDFQATVVVATHRDPSHKNMLAKILSYNAAIRVSEPFDGEQLSCTTIYVGSPKDSVQIDGREFDVELKTSLYDRKHRIDDLFCSAAKHAGENAVGVILSGTLSDGTIGLKAIQEAGGRCIVQHPDNAQFSDMPRNALAEVNADFVGSTKNIAQVLEYMAKGRRCQGMQEPAEEVILPIIERVTSS